MIITISQRFYNARQSWIYEQIVAIGPRRLRILIRRNAYDEQSYLRGYALDPEKLAWNLLVDRPIEGAACKSVSYIDAANQRPFDLDAEDVLKELQAILK